MIRFYSDPKNEFVDTDSYVFKKKCLGICKVKKTVAEMKAMKDAMEEELAQLKKDVEKWEKAAAAEEPDEEDKEFRKKMDFTGKCIVIFSKSDDAVAAQKRFNYFKYQQCFFDCIHDLICFFRVCTHGC